MCGRYSLRNPDVEAVARSLAAELVRELDRQAYKPRWNVAPTEEHWIVRLQEGRRLLVPARFGMPGRPGQPLVINARSETAATRPMFREAFVAGRCLVPADGFYEWRRAGRERHPFWFHEPDERTFTFAGLVAERGGQLSYVILTTAANEVMREVHDRMPVVLSDDSAAAWLERGDPAVLIPAPAGRLVAREVVPLVNRVGLDGPELLDAPAPERQLKLL